MKRRAFLITIFSIALALRLAPVILAYSMPIGLDDMYQYDMLARSIVAGDGFRWYGQQDLELFRQYFEMKLPPEYDPRGVLTSFRAPGYPGFLAIVYAVFGVEPTTWGVMRYFPTPQFRDGYGYGYGYGASYLTLTRFFFARLAQAFLGAALAPLTWALARKIGFGERTARWAAILIAAWPLLIAYTMGLATENTFVVLLTLALVLLLHAAESGRLRDAALAGGALGLTALTRSVASAFMPLAAAWLFLGRRLTQINADKKDDLRSSVSPKRRLGLTALMVACFFAVTVPWAIRNTIVHGHLTWIESALGYDLYMGYHPQSTGTFQYGISLDLMPILDDGVRNERGMEAFWGFVHDNPGRIPYLMARKAGYLWALDRRAFQYFYGNGFLGQWPTWVVWLVLLLDCGPLVVLAPAAAVGMACGQMDRRKALLALLLLYYTGIHMLILAEPRFHLPLFPVIAILAAYAFVERPWRESRPWQRGLALLVIALLFLNWGLEVARDWGVLVKLLGPEGYKLGLPY